MQQRQRLILTGVIAAAILSGLPVTTLGRIPSPAERIHRRRVLEQNRNNPRHYAEVKKNLVYASVNGIDLKLDIYVPKNAATALPLVVWIHGGGWRSGSKMNPRALPLAKEGFAVASINYRLTDVAVFPAQIHDCKAAIRYLRANAKEHNIDPDRIGVWGSSAGGHLAALLGTSNGKQELEGKVGKYLETSSDVQAVCDWFGPSDFLTMPIGKRKFKEGEDPEIKFLGGPISKKLVLAELCSPVTHVTKDAPPFLIMHGDKDTLVPLQQSQLLHDRLKGEGADVTLIVMEDTGHGFRNITSTFDPVLTFFQRTLAKPVTETSKTSEK